MKNRPPRSMVKHLEQAESLPEKSPFAVDLAVLSWRFVKLRAFQLECYFVAASTITNAKSNTIVPYSSVGRAFDC